MAPLVTILIFAVIGFIIHDVVGLVVGAGIGWGISMLIGIAATIWSGGLLPRKARKETARIFYMNHQPTVDACFEGMAEVEKIRFIEDLLERVFRRATVAAPLASKSMGMTPIEINEAAKQEAAEEQDPNVREIILLVKEHIIQTMY